MCPAGAVGKTVMFILYLSVAICTRLGCFHNVDIAGAYVTRDGCVKAAGELIRSGQRYPGEEVSVQFPTCVKGRLEDLPE